jgi:hypothetical protein
MPSVIVTPAVENADVRAAEEANTITVWFIKYSLISNAASEVKSTNFFIPELMTPQQQVLLLQQP